MVLGTGRLAVNNTAQVPIPMEPTDELGRLASRKQMSTYI